MENELTKIGNRSTCPAAVLIRDGKVLLGLRHYLQGPTVWTMPAGKCEDNEMVESALRREVKEEIGITDLKILKYLGEVAAVNYDGTVPLFICTTEQEPQLMEPDKFSSWQWFDPESLPANLINTPALELVRAYLAKG